jgi:hypothetical protein
MADLSARYVHDPMVVSRVIAGEAILVPIQKSPKGLENIFTLNETAALAWTLMDGEHSLEEIRDRIVDEYEVSVEEAEQDLLELVGQFEEIKAIQVV